jgi:hypothetical protein
LTIYDISGNDYCFGGGILDIEKSDPSFNQKAASSFKHRYSISLQHFNKLFLSNYNLEYISEYFVGREDLRVVTHPKKTNTCFEKADLLGDWDPLNVIKVLYFEEERTKSLYAIVIPETGCFIDKNRINEILGLPTDAKIRKAKILPKNMSYGTCSPFVVKQDIDNHKWSVKKILFDKETLICKKEEKTLDDFSFGLDHRMSIQMNYYECCKMLSKRYPDIVKNGEVLKLSFKERFVREKGKIKINYQFNTLNYRTAKFINGIHGYGDVTIENDHIDELYLPDVLTTPLDVKQNI